METTIILLTGGILYLSGILFAFEAVKILNISLNLYTIKGAKPVENGKNVQKWLE